MTYYYVRPIAGFAFAEEQDLVVIQGEFPENVNLVRVRGWNDCAPCGYIEGDGVIEIRRVNARIMRVTKVSQISGFATAYVTECNQ